MANTQGPIRTGAFWYLQFGYERAAFGTEAVTKLAVFGLEQKISGWTYTNNVIPLAQLNCIHIKTYAYGQTQGKMSIDFVMSNPWFLDGLFDSAVYCAGGACTADTQTYTIVDKQITSAGIDVGLALGGGACQCVDVLRQLNGVIFNSANIKSSIGDTVRVSLDVAYASEDTTVCPTLATGCGLATETIGTGPCENIPFTFAHGTLQFPDGACGVIGELQDIDITINQASEMLFQQGSHVAVDAYRKLFEITGKFTAPMIDQVQLAKVFAQTGVNGTTELEEQPTMTLIFTNGAADEAERSLVITLVGITIPEHSTNLEPNEPIFEDIPWQARTISAVFSGEFADPVAIIG